MSPRRRFLLRPGARSAGLACFVLLFRPAGPEARAGMPPSPAPPPLLAPPEGEEEPILTLRTPAELSAARAVALEQGQLAPYSGILLPRDAALHLAVQSDGCLRRSEAAQRNFAAQQSLTDAALQQAQASEAAQRDLALRCDAKMMGCEADLRLAGSGRPWLYLLFGLALGAGVTYGAHVAAGGR